MTKRDKVKRFSELIGEAYKSWKSGLVILDGGTDTGKTYFIVHILGKYAQAEGKKIVYFCNRSELKVQVLQEIKNLDLRDTIYVTTYQSLENKLVNQRELGPFAYIVSDECHYFTNDALFNDYTDVSYEFIKGKKEECVVIYISATAKVFFRWLRKNKKVAEQNYYAIPKSYDYVDKLYFYDKKFLIPKVDEILENEPDSKIIIFCNSLKRMEELYKKYGDTANYMTAKSAKKVEYLRDENCIYEHEDGTFTFDKRILVTTKVLDNGVNIKDKRIKHIFSEILDADSAIQALGRKRKIADDDTCTFYLKDYPGRAIQGLINTNEYQTAPVLSFMTDYPGFTATYGKNRKRIRQNRIFQMKFEKNKDDSRLVYNKIRLKKYMMDKTILNEMRESSYQSIMLELLGAELAGKAETLDMFLEEKDEFKEYLQSLEGKWLYKEDRTTLLPWFESIDVKLKKEGINTMNGALKDHFEERYKCRFRNRELNEEGKAKGKRLVDNRRKLPDGTDNPNRNKKYWILDEFQE